VVLAVAVIGNDNLQDLKTGQLVNATPWKQQVGLLIGVVAGSCVVPPVLELLNHANGFVGAPNLTRFPTSRWPRRSAADLDAGQGRHRRQSAMESARLRRADRPAAGAD
jgi:uncharacterized oligopeptide transporter (OPT) family protein